MKKLVIALLIATMLFASVLPISAAEVKDYATAADGELLYTVNFTGTDGVFAPTPVGEAANNFDYTPSADGSSITVKGKEGGPESSMNFWGGTIEGLTATKETPYSVVYKVKSNGTVGKNNSIGVGIWVLDGNFELDGSHVKFYNNYGNHNTTAEDGSIADRRSALSIGGNKLNQNYVMWSGIDAYDIDADGFVTMMIEYCKNNKNVFSAYILKEGATDVTDFANWIKLGQDFMRDLNKTEDQIGLGFYTCYNVVDVTVKDVKIYKNTVYSAASEEAAKNAPKETKPAETDAPVADATEPLEETEAPAATDAPVEEKGGCGGTIALSGLATLAVIGTATIVASKKKEN